MSFWALTHLLTASKSKITCSPNHHRTTIKNELFALPPRPPFNCKLVSSILKKRFPFENFISIFLWNQAQKIKIQLHAVFLSNFDEEIILIKFTFLLRIKPSKNNLSSDYRSRVAENSAVCCVFLVIEWRNNFSYVRELKSMLLGNLKSLA